MFGDVRQCYMILSSINKLSIDHTLATQERKAQNFNLSGERKTLKKRVRNGRQRRRCSSGS